MSLPTSDAIRAARTPICVIARSERDDAIQLFLRLWIASLALAMTRICCCYSQ